MKSYEYSAWVTIKAKNEDAARRKLESMQNALGRSFPNDDVWVSIDDGEPIELDEDLDE